MKTENPEKESHPKAEKRQKILNAALQLFATWGYNSTPVSEIAITAGVAKGLIYNYFEHKRSILVAIFEEFSDQILCLLPQPEQLSNKDHAEIFIDSLFNHMDNNKEIWKLFMQLSLQPGILEVFIEQGPTQRINTAQSLFIKHFKHPESKDPATSMLLFSSLLKGFIMQYLFSPETFATEQRDKIKLYIKNWFINPENIYL